MASIAAGSGTGQSWSSWLPLLLSIVAGAGTFVGGALLLIALPKHTQTRETPLPPLVFGQLQATAAGVMCILSVNLLAEGIAEIGGWSGVVWAGIGALIMYGIEAIIPHGDDTHSHGHGELNHTHSEDAIALSENPGEPKSLTDSTMEWFGKGQSKPSLVRTSFVTYLGLALHNLPEGISVALTTATNLRLGVSLCVAILLHNILEGMVVALPLWFATGSVQRVLVLTLLNGLMEPLGVIIAWLMGGALLLDGPGRVERVLCAVAGVMTVISFGELVPNAKTWIRRGMAQTSLSAALDGNVSAAERRIPDKVVNFRAAMWLAAGMLGGGLVLKAADLILSSLEL